MPRKKSPKTETPLCPEAVARWLEFSAKVVAGIRDPEERMRWQRWADEQNLCRTPNVRKPGNMINP